MTKKLCKSRTDIKFDGVCGGIAKYLNVDVTVIRIVWIFLSLFTGLFPGLFVYFVCAVIMPREDDYIDLRDDYKNDNNNNYN